MRNFQTLKDIKTLKLGILKARTERCAWLGSARTPRKMPAVDVIEVSAAAFYTWHQQPMSSRDLFPTVSHFVPLPLGTFPLRSTPLGKFEFNMME